MSSYEKKDLKSKNIEPILQLGKLTMDFARVDRVPRYPDSKHESDVEHSYMLGLVAAQLASELYPELDPQLVHIFSTVHDLPEVIVGDTPTLAISDEDRSIKEAAEAEAVEELVRDLPTFWSKYLQRYEEQIEPESRFVRMVDKLMPLIVDISGSGATTLGETYGIETAEQLREAERGEGEMLRARFPEFEALHLIFEELSEIRVGTLFPDTT